MTAPELSEAEAAIVARFEAADYPTEVAEAAVPPCPRCGSHKWVSVSLDTGYTRQAQCVPCGRMLCRTLGPGWKAGW